MGVDIRRGSISEPRLRQSLRRLLLTNTLASFATVSPGGQAHVHTAYFAISRRWTLIFYSYPSSRHVRNLARNSSMAVTVFDTHQRWGKPDKGVQLFGRCRELTGAAAVAAWRVYSQRFRGAERWRTSSIHEEGGFALRPYGFHPSRAKIFDEPRLGEGKFFEVRIPRAPSSR